MGNPPSYPTPPPEPEMFAVADQVYINLDHLITDLTYRMRRCSRINGSNGSYYNALYALCTYLKTLRGEWS